jgi:hypothetical protein
MRARPRALRVRPSRARWPPACGVARTEPRDAAEERHVLARGKGGVDGDHLRDVADRASDRMRFAVGSVAGDGGSARRRHDQRGEHAERRGLARAVRTDKAEQLTGRDLEAQPVESRAIAEYHPQIFHGDGRGSRLADSRLTHRPSIPITTSDRTTRFSPRAVDRGAPPPRNEEPQSTLPTVCQTRRSGAIRGNCPPFQPVHGVSQSARLALRSSIACDAPTPREHCTKRTNRNPAAQMIKSYRPRANAAIVR